MSVLRKAALLFCVLSLAIPVAAQEPESQTRCEVTGPLVISAYMAFLTEVSKKDRNAAASEGQNVASLIELYDRLGCPIPALQGAVECLTAKLLDPDSAQTPVTMRDAEACMRSAGMSVR